MWASFIIAAAALGLSPREAAALAADDIQSVLPASQPFQRYIWTGKGKETHGAMSFVVNSALSQATTIIDPVSVAGGELLRIDFRTLAPQADDYRRLVKTWEGLDVIEPYFHQRRIAAVPEYLHTDGKRYTGKWIAEPAHHTDLKTYLLLTTLTQSSVPIVRGDWFTVIALSTQPPGRYYDFRGTEKSGGGKTALQKWLEKSGTSEALVASLRSDERAAMVFSGITSRQRRVDVFFGVGVRPSVGLPLVSITHDISSADVGADQDALKNLLVLNDRAREAFRTLPSGLREMALFDGNGERQDFVPQEVAHDSTIPDPYDQTLQGLHSCIACHGPDGMYRPVRNDVATMLRAGGDVLGDFSGKKSASDTLDRLAGLYAGDLNQPLTEARRAHAVTVFRLTRGMSVPEVCAKIASIRNAYEFTKLTPATICRELGYEATEENGVETFNKIVPRLPGGVEGAFPLLVRADIGLTRRQFEQEFADFALRAETERLRTKE